MNDGSREWNEAWFNLCESIQSDLKDLIKHEMTYWETYAGIKTSIEQMLKLKDNS